MTDFSALFRTQCIPTSAVDPDIPFLCMQNAAVRFSREQQVTTTPNHAVRFGHYTKHSGRSPHHP